MYLVDREKRKGKLGSSHIAAVVGENPYMSAFDVWLELTGRSEPKPETWEMFYGKVFEKIQHELFKRKEPSYDVAVCQETLVHPDYPDFIATPDCMVFREDVGIGFLEGKTSNFFLREHWEDDRVPRGAHLQLMWQLGFNSGVGYGFVQGVLGNRENQTIVRRFPRDEELIEMLFARATAFMELVRSDTPPMPTDKDSASVRRFLDKEKPAIEGKVIAIPESVESLLEDYKRLDLERLDLNRKAEERKKALDEIKTKLTLMLGDAVRAEANGYAVYLDKYVKTGYFVKPIDKVVTVVEYPTDEPKRGSKKKVA